MEERLTARELGRRGGKKGGLARAAALSPEARKAIARKAAVARWGVSDDTDGGEVVWEIIMGDLFRLKEKIVKMQGEEELRETLLRLIEKGTLHFSIRDGEPTYVKAEPKP